MNLYDTFSVVKGCSLFMGRSSGNESLMCFLPHIPIIEVSVTIAARYSACKLHPNVIDVNEPIEAEDIIHRLASLQS